MPKCANFPFSSDNMKIIGNCNNCGNSDLSMSPDLYKQMGGNPFSRPPIVPQVTWHYMTCASSAANGPTPEPATDGSQVQTGRGYIDDGKNNGQCGSAPTSIYARVNRIVYTSLKMPILFVPCSTDSQQSIGI